MRFEEKTLTEAFLFKRLQMLIPLTETKLFERNVGLGGRDNFPVGDTAFEYTCGSYKEQAQSKMEWLLNGVPQLEVIR